MATMKVVIVDPHSSQPLKGITVEAHAISDGSFISTAVTNDYGVAEFSLTVDASYHARTVNTPPLYQPVVPRTPPGIMNVDYVVASDASGTHTTLALAVAAAIAAGGAKTIWLCHSVTESDIDLGGLASAAKITIASHSQHSVTITANVNEDIFKQDSSGGDGGGGLHFRNAGFSIPSAGRAIYDINTGAEINELQFSQCAFNGGYLARQDGNDSLNDVDIEVRDCTGALAGFYKVAGASATYSPKLLYVYGCTLGLSKFWDGGSTNAAPEENALIRSSVLSITNGLTFPTGNWEGHTFSDLFIFFAGAEALFTTSASSASLEDFTFQNITVRFSSSSGTFGNFGSASINNNDGLFLDGIYGHMAEGVGAGGTFITVDTDWLNVYVGDIFGKDFATQYSGPLTDMDATHFHTLLRDADNDTLIQVEEGADEDIIRFDTGGSERMNLDGANLSLAVPVDMGGNVINNVGDPVLGGDAVNLNTLLDSLALSLHYHFGASNVMSSVFSAGEAFEDELITGTPQELTTIFQVSTAADTPTPATVSAGSLIPIHFDAAVLAVSGKKPVFVYVQLGYVDADGSSNFVQIGSDSDPTTVALTTDKEEVELHLHVGAETNIPAGKRLKVKWWATTTGALPDPTVHIYYGALTDHITIPLSASILFNFLRKDGSTPLTDRWNPGAQIIGNFDFDAKPRVLNVGDDNFVMALAAGLAVVQFASSDVIRYTRATNTWAFRNPSTVLEVSPSGVATDVIAEIGAGNGVTVDGLLIKDGKIAKYGPHTYYIPLGMDTSGAPITP